MVPASRPPAGVAARKAALDVLTLVREGASLDVALSKCRSFEALRGADRSFARALASTVLRRQGSLDHLIGAWIEKPLPRRAGRVTDILRLAAAQTALMGVPHHAAISTAVAVAAEFRETSGYGGLINAVGRKMARVGPATLERLPVRADTPGWLWRSWERAYGPARAREIAEAHRREPPLDLTPRSPAEAPEIAEAVGGRVLPGGSVRLEGAADIASLPGYADGKWWVQDAAAAIPARLSGAASGSFIYDLCAAPGGKTLQLAAAGAEVVAVDRSGERLKFIAENLKRVGLQAETVKADILDFAPGRQADVVLLDAPCTATGTIRRHPDILWSRREADVAALAALQSRLIDRAAALVAPGGALIYAVCSLQPEEGEQQIESALARHAILSRELIAPEELPGLPGAATGRGDVRTLPSMLAGEGGIDGFYIARLRRRPI